MSDAGTDIPAEKFPETPPAGWGSTISTLSVNEIHREAINIRTASVFQPTSFIIQPNRHYIVSIYDKGSQSSIPSGALAQAMIRSNNLRALPAISASDVFSLDSTATFISIQGVDDDTLSAGFSNIYRLGRSASNTLLIASSSENDDAFPLIIEEFVLTHHNGVFASRAAAWIPAVMLSRVAWRRQIIFFVGELFANSAVFAVLPSNHQFFCWQIIGKTCRT